MFSYESVSIGSLYAKYFSKETQNVIDKNRLKTIKDLLIFMENNKDIDFSIINRRLEKIIEQIDNNKDKEPLIYKIKEYEDNILSYNDKINYGNILLLKSPTSAYSAKYNILMYMTISRIINDLSLATPNGENYLVKSIHKLGYSAIPTIVNALNMYRDQIVRQSKLTSKTDENLLKLNSNEKISIVENNYNEIIDYILNNSKELIWGKLTIPQKKLYESTMVNNTKMDNIIKKDMIINIANYTTLPELENLSNGDYQVLKRFIKK